MTGRRAWLVVGFGARGIVWAESRGRARMVAVRAAQVCFDLPTGQLLAGLAVRRAPEHDGLAGHFRPEEFASLDVCEDEWRKDRAAAAGVEVPDA
jgi:hypothetical protein